MKRYCYVLCKILWLRIIRYALYLQLMRETVAYIRV